MFDAKTDLQIWDGSASVPWVMSEAVEVSEPITPDELRLDITLFPDKHAKTQERRNVAWSEVGAIIASEPGKRDKGECPAIKLMRFGGVVSEAGCLRTNDNATEITGVEGDYDQEGITPEQAISALEAAGIKALVYTTWSHTEDKPRWRVLAPISKPQDKAARLAYIEAVNGMLGGILAKESAVISQAMYFGHGAGGSTRVLYTFGDHAGGVCIDQLESWQQYRNAWSKKATIRRSTNNDLTDRPAMPSLKLEYTPENVVKVEETMRLAGLSPDDDRAGWMVEGVWPILSLGDAWVGFAREWSMRSSRFSEDGFNNVVDSYQEGRTGFETVIKRAVTNGGVNPFQRAADLTATDRLTGDKSDILNGRLFAGMHRDRLMWVHELCVWLSFDSAGGWTAARPEAPMNAAKAVVAHLQQLAAAAISRADGGEIDGRTKRLIAHADRSSTAQKMRDMIEVGRSESGMTVLASELDANPYHLGLRNCIIDLASLRRVPYTPDQRTTKRASAGLIDGARCDAWVEFLREVLPDRDVRRFMRVFCGQMLIGRVEQQRFLFLFGQGANGKSIFVNVLSHVLGEYARSIPTETLTQQSRSSQGPSPDLMMLRGLRMAFATETEEGSRFAESRVKALTSSEPITAREPHGRFVTFIPSHTLIISGNHTPIVHDDSWGMWRRMCLVPFEVTIPPARQDPKLFDKLIAEADGIMSWMLSGLRDYQRGGLVIPGRVDTATQAYRSDMDSIGDWLHDMCELNASEREDKQSTFNSYRQWAESNGLRPMSGKALTRRLSSRGVRLDSGKRNYLGLAVRAHRPAGA